MSDEELIASMYIDEVYSCVDLGIKLLLYCDEAGITTNEAFELIVSRGEYLKQEPEVNQE